MGNKRFINSDTETKLDFLNERIVKYKKNNSFRLLILLLLLVIVLMIAYIYFKPSFLRDFLENDSPDESMKNSAGEMVENVSTQSIESTEEQDNKKENIEVIMTAQELSDYSICKLYLINNADDSQGVSGDFITSGIVVGAKGKISILTFYENLATEDEVYVSFSNGEKYVGKVKKGVAECNIALVELDEKIISNDELQIIKAVTFSEEKEFFEGQEVTFIGNTAEKNTIIKKGSLTLSENTVSIMDTQIQLFSTDISHSAQINGFMFDEKGHLIGIVREEDYNTSENSISFASLNSIRMYIDCFVGNNLVPYIGIYGEEVTEDVINNIDSQMPFGIYISKIKKDSPAYNVGIVNGDVVISINSKEVKNFSDYSEELKKFSNGQQVMVAVMRKGKEGYKRIEYQITVGGLD